MNAKRLKGLRCSLGLTQADLASRLHLSPSAIEMYERSEREPKNRTLVEMAALFHVTTDYLLGCSDNAFGTYPFENVPIVAEVREITEIINRLKQIEERLAKLEQAEQHYAVGICGTSNVWGLETERKEETLEQKLEEADRLDRKDGQLENKVKNPNERTKSGQRTND